MAYRKKLIEVSLPLEAINVESAREKSIRHGHPSTLHLWWARRPLAACRAVLFSSMVDDPSEYMPDEESADIERQRLFRLIEELVKWENIQNEELYDKAKLEIAKSVARDLGVPTPVGKHAIERFLQEQAPPVLDPFAGGGSIPLEAQRLGLRAYASDLNPVAVLINKAMIEIPPKFANQPPVHPVEDEKEQKSLFQRQWKGAEGLAEDVRYYGQWMRDEAERRIEHLYPKVEITKEILAERPDLKLEGYKVGEELTVIAWLWVRTVTCPNPACGLSMPLTKSFSLSTKKNNPVWLLPVIKDNKVTYKVMLGPSKSKIGETVNRTGATCIACNTPVTLQYIRDEAQNHKLTTQLLAIVTEGKHGRIYFEANNEHISCVEKINPKLLSKPQQELTGKLAVSVPLYGIKTFGDLYTNRQLLSLNTFNQLLKELRENLISNNEINRDYVDAIITYISFIFDKASDAWSSLVSWRISVEASRNTFSRQALAMTWDFTEVNPFSNSCGNWMGAGVDWVQKALECLPVRIQGKVTKQDATELNFDSKLIISTDPPYYDNIEYASLSDFFYIWLRENLKDIYQDIFQTLLVPKEPELVASPFRFKNKQDAEKFFENGLYKVFQNAYKFADSNYPMTVYYAFKQAESQSGKGTSSTGWETMLEGLIQSGFKVLGTWPMRTEKTGRMIQVGSNALASSIVLVCRPREEFAVRVTRRQFIQELRQELPKALHQLQQGNIAPVDLAQAAIGPGMAIFSKYDRVLEADGSSMRVRDALALINEALDAYFSEQEGAFDQSTRWCLAWFEQFTHRDAEYGVAEVLSKAKNTSVETMSNQGFIKAEAGKVQLYHRDQLPELNLDRRNQQITDWETTQYLIRALKHEGESAAGRLLQQFGSKGENARDLAYRLYAVCERKNRAQEAIDYNALVVAWPRIKELAAKTTRQESLL
jgi:putative DNA methylase